MKIKFDSNQDYQLEAIQSFVDLFDGQPLNKGDFSVELGKEVLEGQTSLFQSELGIGNNLVIDKETVLKNLHIIQERNDIDETSKEDFQNNGFNFSAEMETGTGKTYVYLRTIFELSQKYDFKKFIIVVPSVAIREVLQSNLQKFFPGYG